MMIEDVPVGAIAPCHKSGAQWKKEQGKVERKGLQLRCSTEAIVDGESKDS